MLGTRAVLVSANGETRTFLACESLCRLNTSAAVIIPMQNIVGSDSIQSNRGSL